jgi:hypothetical protein
MLRSEAEDAPAHKEPLPPLRSEAEGALGRKEPLPGSGAEGAPVRKGLPPLRSEAEGELVRREPLPSSEAEGALVRKEPPPGSEAEGALARREPQPSSSEAEDELVHTALHLPNIQMRGAMQRSRISRFESCANSFDFLPATDTAAFELALLE